MIHAVIIAGGSGTRFWPESRGARPKQLLRLVGERSMIQATVDRLGALVPPERVWISTGARLVDATAAALPRVPRAHLLAEPVVTEATTDTDATTSRWRAAGRPTERAP